MLCIYTCLYCRCCFAIEHALCLLSLHPFCVNVRHAVSRVSSLQQWDSGNTRSLSQEEGHVTVAPRAVRAGAGITSSIALGDCTVLSHDDRGVLLTPSHPPRRQHTHRIRTGTRTTSTQTNPDEITPGQPGQVAEEEEEVRHAHQPCDAPAPALQPRADHQLPDMHSRRARVWNQLCEQVQAGPACPRLTLTPLHAGLLRFVPAYLRQAPGGERSRLRTFS